MTLPYWQCIISKCTTGMSGKEAWLVIEYFTIQGSIYFDYIFLGFGEYKLSKQFLNAGIPSDEVNLIPSIPLEDIVASIKNPAPGKGSELEVSVE